MIELLQIFVDNIAPILLIAGIGYIAGRRLNLETNAISALIFNVLSPSLVFYSLYNSNIGGDEVITLFLGVVFLQLSMLVLTSFVLWLQTSSPGQRANVLLSTVSMNTGNYGLSLVAFAFGDSVLSRAVIIFVANSMMNYTLGIYIASHGSVSAWEALKSVLRTPALYAVIAAFVLRALNMEIPLILSRSVKTLSDAAIPMLLILLGLQLARYQPVPRAVNLLSTGVGLRLFISPLIALLLTMLLTLTGEARIAFIIQASMPTAVITLVLATEYHLDRNLALTFIFISTLLSPFTLSVLVAFLR